MPPMGQSGGYDIGRRPDDRFSAGLVEQRGVEPPPPPIMHTSSLTPVIQNRRRVQKPAPASAEESRPPQSLTSLPAHLVADAHRQTNQDMSALHKKLATLYSPEQFEPTPINPNHQLSMEENVRLDSPQGQNPQSDNLDFDKSMEFDKIFQKSPKPPKSSSSNIDDLSNQLSNMSFSVGDIADTGNLSSLFDDSSLKLKERSTSPGDSAGKRSGSNTGGNKNTLNFSTSLGPADMSLSTFGGESLVGNMQSMNMSTTSFTNVFEESTDKV